MSNNKIKILYLGKKNKKIFNFFHRKNITFKFFEKNINNEKTQFFKKYEYLISFNYRHILKKRILSLFKQNALNCHISYLPWNKGAHPNFWSFHDNTKKGISIHILDEGVDTGDIIFQKKILFSNKDTLYTTHKKLNREMENYLIKKLPLIFKKKYKVKKQNKVGSFHKKKDINKYLVKIKNLYKLNVSKIKKLK